MYIKGKRYVDKETDLIRIIKKIRKQAKSNNSAMRIIDIEKSDITTDSEGL